MYPSEYLHLLVSSIRKNRIRYCYHKELICWKISVYQFYLPFLLS